MVDRARFIELILFVFVNQASSFSSSRSLVNVASRFATCHRSVVEQTQGWFPTRIQQQITAEDIIAVRVAHTLLETDELARVCLEQVKQGKDFETIARSISTCEETRADGGMVGWVGLNDSHLDELLPREARESALKQKPGDVVLCATTRGTHLLKIVDIMTRINAKRTSAPGRKLPGAGFELPVLAEQLSGAPGVQPTYFFETMGCQMNFADTERMAGQLEDMGMRAVDKADSANLIVLNTCSIRDKPEQKVYSYLGPHAVRKRRGEPVAIVVAGCVAQQEGERLLRRVPEIDLVMGPQYSNRIGDLLEDVMNGNQLVATDPLHIMEDMTKPKRGSTVAAWVNVIYGCNEHCTYCVVPGTRGVEQSRPREAILQECETLVKEGYREITLLGQNIDAWGRDMEPKQKFADLLSVVCQVQGLERVRFATSHPRYMSPRVVTAVRDHESAMEVFHIPFQSGDNEVLKNMRRGYTRESFLAIVQRIRDACGDDAAITADLIVGFPGETDEQFQRTLTLLEEVKFDACMTSAYSARPNTPAALWGNQVDDATKMERLQTAKSMVARHAEERAQRFLGRVEQVLVEVRNIKDPRQVMGRTRTNKQVFFDGDIDELKGKMVHVKVVEIKPWCLVAERVMDVEPY